MPDGRSPPAPAGSRRRPVRAVALGLGAILLAGCSTTTLGARGCGTGAAADICVGGLSVPAKKRDLFEQASRQAIDAIASAEFERGLAEFIAHRAAGGSHSGAWREKTAPGIVAGLKAGLPGVRIVTYGGIIGWFKYKFSGELATDGGGTGRIRINRWGIESAATIAQSIAHEAAHQPPLELEHPRYDAKDYEAGQCEPPYVIGTLVRKQIEGPGWTVRPTDCHLLRNVGQVALQRGSRSWAGKGIAAAPSPVRTAPTPGPPPYNA